MELLYDFAIGLMGLIGIIGFISLFVFLDELLNLKYGKSLSYWAGHCVGTGLLIGITLCIILIIGVLGHFIRELL